MRRPLAEMAALSVPQSGPSLEQMVAAVSSARSRNGMALSLLNMSEEHDASKQNLTRLVTRDRSLAGRLRHVANSEAASLAHPIPTIRHAMDALGFRAVHSAALACTFIDMLDGPCANLHYISFWRHSVEVAMLAEVLGAVEQRHRNEAFSAALLHNVGRLVLDQHAPATLEEALRDAARRRMPLAKALRQLLGYSDTQLAGAITIRWGLPNDIVEAIETWRSIGSLSGTALSALVARAATFATTIGLSDGLNVDDLPAAGPEATAVLKPLRDAMEQLGGLKWLRSRVDTIIEAALLS